MNYWKSALNEKGNAPFLLLSSDGVACFLENTVLDFPDQSVSSHGLDPI
jgi:hypothetical protein